jgi:hypothetical protein
MSVYHRMVVGAVILTIYGAVTILANELSR